ncbi:MAG: DUF3800 domain-containing protein [Patescibacteria group bacterium]
MKTFLLFIDDCYGAEAEKVALTGLLIPTNSYAELRRQFYQLLSKKISPTPTTIQTPPELHGCDLLRNESDEEKLRILKGVKDLVLSNSIRIHRTCIYETDKIIKIFSGDTNGPLSACWLYFISGLDPILKDILVIPVFDFVDKEKIIKLSGMIKSADIIRESGHNDLVSIKNSKNIIGEVFYADSGHSIFIQATDLISYLLHSQECVATGSSTSQFKKQVADIAKELLPAFINVK